MAIPAVFEITDGTNTVDLLDAGGVHLSDWRPGVLEYKEGGIFRDSPLSDGRQPVIARRANIIDELNVKIRGSSTDDAIGRWIALGQLLDKAVHYWTSRRTSEPVWIKAQASCETNPRYALIAMWRVPELGNPFAPPFLQPRANALLDDISVFIEHLPWQHTIPGTGECVQTHARQRWEYDAWSVSTAGPTFNVASMIVASCGYLIAGERGQSWRTQTGLAGSWAASAAFIYGACVTGPAAGCVYSTTDCGATWAVVTNTVGSDAYNCITYDAYADEIGGADTWLMAGGTLLNGAASPGIWAGTTLATQVATESWWTSTGFVYYCPQSRDVYFSAYYSVPTLGILYKYNRLGVPPGGTYELIQSTGSGNLVSMLEASDGFLYVGGNGEILGSETGDYWSSLTTSPTGSIIALWEDAEGRIWALENRAGGVVWYSNDKVTWNSITVTANNQYSGIYFPTSDLSYIGDSTSIYQSAGAVNMGRTETCDREVYFSNKQAQLNISHVRSYDASAPSYTDRFPMSATYNLYSGVPMGAGDAIYFGIASALQANGDPPFDNLVFDIDDELVTAAGFTSRWEYWNGAWVALTVTDNTDTYGNPFDTPGVNSVHWVPPTDWAPTAVNGLNGMWVRAFVTAIGGGVTQAPTQQNRDPYTVIWPRIDIDADEVPGDIAALLRAMMFNESDYNGPEQGGPDLYSNRLLMGLRSLGRGEQFVAYLNCSDEQNPPGITATASTNTTIASPPTDDESITGRRAVYLPAAAPEAIATRVQIDIGTDIATQFYGTYHAFLRVNQESGSVGDFQLRLELLTGAASSGLVTETRITQTASLAPYELLDMGQVVIPASMDMTLDDPPDTLRINVQAGFLGGATGPEIDLIDVILLPVDEWAGDFVDLEDGADSNIEGGHLLDVDSIANPKRDIRSLVRQDGSRFVTAVYDPRTNGPSILQQNADQRIWFLTSRSYVSGNGEEVAQPWVAHSVQLWKVQRYLAMRGAT